MPQQINVYVAEDAIYVLLDGDGNDVAMPMHHLDTFMFVSSPAEPNAQFVCIAPAP